MISGEFMKIWMIFAICLGSVYIFAMTDQEKIQYLIDQVGKSNMTFIRNGNEHSPSRAKSHLELKLSKSNGSCSVEDFINKIASKSSITGEPYYIKYPDGRMIKAADWFREKLKNIESTGN